jgi:ribose 5-phosphate isomerase B
MNIAIASDHAGFDLKTYVIKKLKKAGYQIQDFGPDSDSSVDYADFGHKVAFAVERDANVLGILICGSGNGICMTANKHKGIRAALCWTPEISALARQHNNANILCLPARFLSKMLAGRIIDSFLSSEFEGGRHQKRIDKIPC